MRTGSAEPGDRGRGRSADPMRMATYSTTSFAGWYFLFQGTAIVGWWIWLSVDPAALRLFLPDGAGRPELLAFALPDLALAAAGSLVAAWTFFRGTRWQLAAAWLTAGAVVYATLYCIHWAVLRGDGWLNVAAMAPAALFSSVAAVDSSAGVLPLFRRSRPGSPRAHRVKTLLQIALFWSFFLGLVPAAIRFVGAALGWPTFAFAGQRPLAATLFLLFSALGLASGLIMAGRGAGTPLPFDATNRLVTTGPYAHVRNPMVIAGLGQGAAVGLFLGSWAVLGYVVVGGLVWQLLVRPAEEADLLATFGEDFVRYRDAVRCWIPRSRPYRPSRSRRKRSADDGGSSV